MAVFYKKALASVLAVLMVLVLLPAVPASAAIPTEQQFADHIAALQKEFPSYKYFADSNGKVASGRYRGTSLVGGNGCGGNCGTFAVEGRELGWQCRAYALYLADRIFGSCYNTDSSPWTKYTYSKGTFNGSYYAGDLVQLKMKSGRLHWIFIHRVTADKVYYTDTNRVGSCQISWTSDTPASIMSRTVQLERYNGNTLKGTAAPASLLTVVYDANGGYIPGSENGTIYYKVTTNSGINLRAEASEGSTRLGNIPRDVSFSVTETKVAEGYTWGKTTYGGNTGWCVISEGWTEPVNRPNTTFYTDGNGIIFHSGTGAAFRQIFNDGAIYPEGLANADGLGLVRDGYLFMGWSRQPAGGTLFDQHALLDPRTLCPELATGSQQLTLYAIWGDPNAILDPALPYTDVWKNAWYYPSVKFTFEQKLMNGVSATEFGPEQTTTRAMLVTVLWRLEQSPAPTGANAFTDVSVGQWYTEAVQWAAENQIVNGMGEGLFAPEGKITRAQMATILYRYATFKGLDTAGRAELSTFADAASTPDWAKEGMQWAVDGGLITGIAVNGVLHLQNEGNATRAQMATVLMRYLQKNTSI